MRQQNATSFVWRRVATLGAVTDAIPSSKLIDGFDGQNQSTLQMPSRCTMDLSGQGGASDIKECPVHVFANYVCEIVRETPDTKQEGG